MNFMKRFIFFTKFFLTVILISGNHTFFAKNFTPGEQRIAERFVERARGWLLPAPPMAQANIPRMDPQIAQPAAPTIISAERLAEYRRFVSLTRNIIPGPQLRNQATRAPRINQPATRPPTSRTVPAGDPAASRRFALLTDLIARNLVPEQGLTDQEAGDLAANRLRPLIHRTLAGRTIYHVQRPLLGQGIRCLTRGGEVPHDSPAMRFMSDLTTLSGRLSLTVPPNHVILNAPAASRANNSPTLSSSPLKDCLEESTRDRHHAWRRIKTHEGIEFREDQVNIK